MQHVILILILLTAVGSCGSVVLDYTAWLDAAVLISLCSRRTRILKQKHSISKRTEKSVRKRLWQ